MGDKTKDELLDEARDAGLDVSDKDTKADIEDALDSARNAPPALGPVEDEEGNVTGFETDSTPAKVVSPREYDEVPEELR